NIDSFGKRGNVKKSIVLTDEQGNQSTVWLYLHVKDNPHANASKQSIFDGACGKCHFDPAQGKETGRAIYDAVCVMCHGQNAKGDYAPKLAGYQNATVLQYIIRSGTGTHHMPAFAQNKGGPLNAKQINALSRWIISLDD
ncbi:MAG: cytochrome c, partial [Mariprofundaceae bacterium]|nr:cytochrome c [Mariprofundaceae bacterium]